MTAPFENAGETLDWARAVYRRRGWSVTAEERGVAMAILPVLDRVNEGQSSREQLLGDIALAALELPGGPLAAVLADFGTALSTPRAFEHPAARFLLYSLHGFLTLIVKAPALPESP